MSHRLSQTNARIVLCLYSIAMIIFRDPLLFLTPRFWAEEGTFYFSYAFNNPWWKTLLLYTPNAGYYSLVHNIAALLATIVPLENAPLMTTAFDGIVILTICLTIIFGNAPYWSTAINKFLTVTFTLLLIHPWYWLTSTNMHFHLAMLALVILLETSPVVPPLKAWFHRGCIALCGLSGPISYFLIPAFLWRGLREKNREALVLCGILTTTIVAHLIPFMTLMNMPAGSRFRGMELRSVKNWLYYQFSIPLLGHGPFNEGGWGHTVDNQVAAFLQKSGLLVAYLPFYVISAILCFAIAFWCLYPALRGGRHRIAFIGFLFMSVMSALCSYNMSVGFRYVYVSSVTLLIILIAELTGDHTPPARRLIIGIVLTVSLFSHARDYTVRPYGINYPIWYQQVYMWRVGAIDAPNIWPPGWTVQLTRDKR